MADYTVEYVPDEALAGRDFVLCNLRGDGVHLYFRHGVRDMSDEDNLAVLETAWAAVRQLTRVDFPRQRLGRGVARP